MKKRFFLLVAALLAAAAGALAETAQTASGSGAWGDWLYMYDGAYGGIALTAYLGSDSTVVVPSEIGGEPVKALQGTFRKLALCDEDGGVHISPWHDVAWNDELEMMVSLEYWEDTVNDAIEEVVVPEGIEYIDFGAFRNCTALRSVSLPQSLLYVYSGSFEGCTALERIELPDSLESIGYDAFKGCGMLLDIRFPESLEYIGDGAFEGTGLTEVTLPEAAMRESEIDYVFDPGVIVNGVEMEWPVRRTSQDGFEYDLYERRGCVTICGYNGSETELTIPEELDGWRVASVSSLRGEGKDKVERIVFPETLTELGHSVCYGYRALREVVLPPRLERIENCAFEECESLERVDIPSGVVYIGKYAFWDTALGEVTLPDALTRIEDGAFWNCNLQRVTLPDGVEEIGDMAFGHCRWLKSVAFPDALRRIGEGAFSFCALSRVELPEGLEEIGKEAFHYCDLLESVALPGTLTRIGPGAFSFCRKLKEVELPDGVEEIGEEAFAWCDRLESVTIPDAIRRIDSHAFNRCPKLRQVELPEEIEDMACDAFDPSAHIVRR